MSDTRTSTSARRRRASSHRTRTSRSVPITSSRPRGRSSGYDRFGGAPLTADIFSWFAQPDDIDGFADATVAYHAGTDRYFGASTSWYCGADPIGFLDVGVSATGDPSGVWWIYSFWFPDSVPTSPVIGLSSDKLAIGVSEASITDVCNGSPSPGSSARA